MSADEFSPPERLSADHDFSSFNSGTPVLDDWLRRRGLPNQDSGASRTYVICAGDRVIGYYALAAGAVAQEEANGRARRNMPNPIPAMVLGRLAIDVAYRGRGLGRALLRDAILRSAQAAEIAGIRVLLVHALSVDARNFYERCGFQASPLDPMTLMITLGDIEQPLANTGRG